MTTGPKPKRPAIKTSEFLPRALAWLQGKVGSDGGVKPLDESPSPARAILASPYVAESEPTGGDLAGQPQRTPGQYELALGALVAQRYTDGITHRIRHEAGWMEGLAAFRGIGWHFWDPNAGLTHYRTRMPNQPYRVYASHPITRPRVRKLIARAQSTQVDWSIAPLSDMEEDLVAAQEMDAAFAHIGVKNDWPHLKHRVEKGAISWCPHGIKVRIAEKQLVQMPVWGAEIDAESGQERVVVTEIRDVRAPEILLEEFSIFDCVIDPRAKHWSKAGWVIWETLMPLEEIRQRWPEMAIFINGESGQGGPGAASQGKIRAVTGDLPPQSTPSGQKSAWVKEMWEKPTLMYPRGRVVYECEGTILEVLDFPEGLEHLPFVLLSYDEGLDSPFGISAAQVAVPAQDNYDQTLSMFRERARERGKILYGTGLGIKHDAFKFGDGWEAIPVDLDAAQGGLGNVVQFLTPPPLPTEAAAMLQQANADHAEVLEVNEVSRGIMPQGVTSGAAYRSMVEQDQSTATLFREQCRAAYQRLGEIIAPLAVLVYGPTSRMLAISDQPLGPDGPEGDDPAQEVALLTQILAQTGATQEQIVQLLADNEADTALSSVSAPKPRTAPRIFQALGRGRVQVVAEVRTVRTPEQRRSDLMTLAQGGFFNEENLESTVLLFEEMGFQQSDRLYRRLIKMLRRRIAEKQAAQPDPAKLAEAQEKARADAAIGIVQATQRAQLAREAALKQLEHANSITREVVAGDALDTDPIAQAEVATPPGMAVSAAVAAYDDAVDPGEGAEGNGDDNAGPALPDALAEVAPAAELPEPGGVEEAGESPLPQE